MVYVPRSWSTPHGIQSGSGNSWRFVSRGSGGKYDMDHTQIRAAFLGAADLPARLRELHRDQVNALLAGESPAPLPADEALTVLTVIPVAVAAGTQRTVDLDDTWQHLPCPLSYEHREHGWNLDGAYALRPRIREEEPDRGTVQIHRDGRVVFADARLLASRGGRRRLPTGVWPAALRDGVAAALGWMRPAGVEAPVVAQVTLARVAGLELTVQDHLGRGQPPLIRDVVELPAVHLDTLALPDDGAAGLGTMFDTLWQAFGLAKAPRGEDLWRR